MKLHIFLNVTHVKMNQSSSENAYQLLLEFIGSFYVLDVFTISTKFQYFTYYRRVIMTVRFLEEPSFWDEQYYFKCFITFIMKNEHYFQDFLYDFVKKEYVLTRCEFNKFFDVYFFIRNIFKQSHNFMGGTDSDCVRINCTPTMWGIKD